MKGRTQVSARAFLYFAGFLVGFGTLVVLGRRSSLVSQAWPLLFWGIVVLASLTICAHLWKARGTPDEIRKAEARSLYGVLHPKLRDWLFP